MNWLRCTALATRPRQTSGFTLIEFVVALVVIGIGAAILLSFTTPMTRSADPMIQAQARALATAYMDEILLRNHGGGACIGTDRATWETVWCYDGLAESPPRDQFGNPIGALAGYTVAVSIGGGGATATVAVNITHDSGRIDWTLQGQRGDYGS